jgi:cytochrome c oxidase assembly protein subunit 15
MQYSRWFVRFNWIALVLIFLVIVAGSLVRITGSGMGCPDWPKCFGQWVPPTTDEGLPADYKDIYSEKRAQKIDKFSSFLQALGMHDTAKKLRTNPDLRTEQDFNGRKTWTEYINRLVGFLAGNALLIAFIWMLLKYRKRKIILVSFINLILMAIQAWFGSIVVASNLVPWTITIHMFLALVIVGLQLYILYLISPRQSVQIKLPRASYILIWLVFLITFYQMFLGTQVREYIDVLIKSGVPQEQWISSIGIPFYIHRSFSWLVLILLVYLAYVNEKGDKISSIRWLFGILALELISGVMLAHLDMPALVRTVHLVFACILFGIITMTIFRSRRAKSIRA